MKRYAVVIEDAGTNLAAYVPDLPGCVVTGESQREVERLIREAIAACASKGWPRMAFQSPNPRAALSSVEIDVDRGESVNASQDGLVHLRVAHSGGRDRKPRGRRLDCRGLRVEDSLALPSGDQHRKIGFVSHGSTRMHRR